MRTSRLLIPGVVTGFAFLSLVSISSVTARGSTDRTYVGPVQSVSRAGTGTIALPRRPLARVLAFERNEGQTDQTARFIAYAKDATVFVTTSGLVLAPVDEQGSRGRPVRMTMLGASDRATFTTTEPLPGRTNYFVGRDRKTWRTGIPTFARVTEQSAYPGIDVAYYGREGEAEYDFIVAPGADPSAIHLSFEGVDRLEVDPHGDLVLTTSDGTLRMKAPLAYQEYPQGRRSVDARFVLRGNTVGFAVGSFDRTKRLVIDPVLAYSSYFGGGNLCCGHTQPLAVDVDASGNIYIAGLQVQNAAFPTTVTYGTQGDMFVSKFSADGTTLLYSAVIGSSGSDAAIDMVVDAAGNAYVFGHTSDSGMDFPTTASAFQPSYGGGGNDTVVLKLSPDGSTLLYSSFLGGPGFDNAREIAIDSTGSAYVVGGPGTGFPLAGNPYQSISHGASELFVAKINPTGTSLVYSTLLGSSGDDHFGGDIAVDASGHAYIVGATNGADFPTTAGAFDTTFNGGGPDGFIVKLSPDGSSLVQATLLGGAAGHDHVFGIDLDAAGNVYVAGWTASGDFPVAGTPFQPVLTPGGPGHDMDVFVAKLDPALSTVTAATYLGGSHADLGTGVAVDAAGNVLVAGETYSLDFPVQSPIQAVYAGAVDAFVAKLNPALSALVYSTYLGGSGVESAESSNPSPCCTNTFLAIDPDGNAVLTGRTSSTDFPVTTSAYQGELRGPTNAFIAIVIETLTVTVDIKPGSFPNSINLGSNGTVPVAILSSDSFDATTVDPLTVTLANASVRLRGNGTPMASAQHVNNDGRLDLVVHVATEALQLTSTDTGAVVHGETYSGQAIVGSDSVRVVQ